MKEFVKILKAKKSQRIEVLRITANIVGKNDPEKWDDFVKSQIIVMIEDDDDLMEKFLTAAFTEVAQELAIKPEENHKLSPQEELLSAIAKLLDSDYE